MVERTKAKTFSSLSIKDLNQEVCWLWHREFLRLDMMRARMAAHWDMTARQRGSLTAAEVKLNRFGWQSDGDFPIFSYPKSNFALPSLITGGYQ